MADISNTEPVYFIQCGMFGGPIKIGKANHPVKRLAALQVASPYPLFLLGTVAGGLVLETQLKQELSGDLIRGEWFKPSRKVIERIAGLLGSSSPNLRRIEAQRTALENLVERFEYFHGVDVPAEMNRAGIRLYPRIAAQPDLLARLDRLGVHPRTHLKLYRRPANTKHFDPPSTQGGR